MSDVSNGKKDNLGNPKFKIEYIWNKLDKPVTKDSLLIRYNEGVPISWEWISNEKLTRLEEGKAELEFIEWLESKSDHYIDREWIDLYLEFKNKSNNQENLKKMVKIKLFENPEVLVVEKPEGSEIGDLMFMSLDYVDGPGKLKEEVVIDNEKYDNFRFSGMIIYRGKKYYRGNIIDLDKLMKVDKWKALGTIHGWCLDLSSKIIPVTNTKMDESSKNIFTTKEECEAMKAKAQLSHFRDLYNKDWRLDRRSGRHCYTIRPFVNMTPLGDRINFKVEPIPNWLAGLLHFKNEADAKRFAEDFRDLIIQGIEIN